MNESRTRHLGVVDADRPAPGGAPRIAALQARIDAGETEAIGALERRPRDDYRNLVEAGDEPLADAVWSWGMAHVADVERAEEHAERESQRAEAPACWAGLRVRVAYITAGGMARPSEIAGRLAGVTDRGIHVLIDELEEERDVARPADAGMIVRRVKAERFVSWSAVLSVQPLPVREVRTLEAPSA